MENQSTQQPIDSQQQQNEFASKKIVKRDFWLIVAYLIVGQFVFPMIGMMIGAIVAMSLKIKSDSRINEIGINFATVFGFIGMCLVLLLFYLMHRKTLIPLAIQRVKNLKKYIVTLIIIIVIMYVLNILYGIMVEFLPEKYQFSDTENNKMLEKMFTSVWMWPVLFLDIVIVTPIVEELLFRHLLIHELGKKLTYGLMYVVSILMFAGVHVTEAQSPFELGPYVIMASSFVAAYHLTKRNLAASIALHMIVNAISFVAILFAL
ncbi:CPBP family intramembrane glutamic endopeptidase [Staphylococcus warneri]|uniref:CPBP family intramembrane glutamic endopeptidase n=1 Tax=Staphylococcus warneri TaxID=1292 RepID=UPI0022E0D45E|nr:CPBP family intramembrane glutamic endopeptidase [Staphylococcus warneri]